MTRKLYDAIKDKPSKEKLRLYRKYNSLSFLLKQELITIMEQYLYYQCRDDDTHCFIITIKDSGKYILVDDYHNKARISNEIIFKFAEEFGLRIESISHEVSEHFDDFNKDVHYTSEVNHHVICYELLRQ